MSPNDKENRGNQMNWAHTRTPRPIPSHCTHPRARRQRRILGPRNERQQSRKRQPRALKVPMQNSFFFEIGHRRQTALNASPPQPVTSTTHTTTTNKTSISKQPQSKGRGTPLAHCNEDHSARRSRHDHRAHLSAICCSPLCALITNCETMISQTQKQHKKQKRIHTPFKKTTSKKNKGCS